jgi:hypothetical protein
MRVTKEDILKIKAGETKCFLVPNALASNSATSMVDYVKKCYLPDGVSNYKTKTEKVDGGQYLVYITAIPCELSKVE